MKIICFGDSNTYGYENLEYIGGRYPSDSRWVDILSRKTGWTIINEGVNGRTIPKVSVPISEDTDLFLIMLGTNDLLQGFDASHTANRMEDFINHLTIDKNKILLIAPPPMVYGFWVTEDKLIEESHNLSTCYRALSEQLRVHFADAGEFQVSLVFDGIHFSKEGHRAFAEGLYQYFMNRKEEYLC